MTDVLDRTRILDRATAPAATTSSPTRQAPSRVVLIRPHHFVPNPATAADNGFQQTAATTGTVSCRTGSAPPSRDVSARAYQEVTGLARTLEAAGVGVELFEDTTDQTPDSVFPNNWFTTHADGTVVQYPMYAPNRRGERRSDVLSHLAEHSLVSRVVDYSPAEQEGRFLEGTGVMVLDHGAKLAYGCRSRRLSPALFEMFCRDLGYTPVLFDAADRAGVPVYHTNVMLSVGTETALIGSSMIRDPLQRSRVLGVLRESGKEVVELSEQQIRSFAGNCLELTGRNARTGRAQQFLTMSTTAERSLTTQQHETLSGFCTLLSADVSTIERAGGSVRCMIAGNHLPPR